jgi:hypothetical protein
VHYGQIDTGFHCSNIMYLFSDNTVKIQVLWDVNAAWDGKHADVSEEILLASRHRVAS